METVHGAAVLSTNTGCHIWAEGIQRSGYNPVPKIHDAACRSQWIYPVLAALMLHCRADLPQAYEALQSGNLANGTGSTAEEVTAMCMRSKGPWDQLSKPCGA